MARRQIALLLAPALAWAAVHPIVARAQTGSGSPPDNTLPAGGGPAAGAEIAAGVANYMSQQPGAQTPPAGASPTAAPGGGEDPNARFGGDNQARLDSLSRGFNKLGANPSQEQIGALMAAHGFAPVPDSPNGFCDSSLCTTPDLLRNAGAQNAQEEAAQGMIDNMDKPGPNSGDYPNGTSMMNGVEVINLADGQQGPPCPVSICGNADGGGADVGAMTDEQRSARVDANSQRLQQEDQTAANTPGGAMGGFGIKDTGGRDQGQGQAMVSRGGNDSTGGPGGPGGPNGSAYNPFTDRNNTDPGGFYKNQADVTKQVLNSPYTERRRGADETQLADTRRAGDEAEQGAAATAGTASSRFVRMLSVGQALMDNLVTALKNPGDDGLSSFAGKSVDNNRTHLAPVHVAIDRPGYANGVFNSSSLFGSPQLVPVGRGAVCTRAEGC